MIFERHSTRSFSDKDVSDEDLRTILKAGCMAPSSKNDQPWRVVILKNQKLRGMCDALSRDPMDGIDPRFRSACLKTFSIMAEAPVGIFVFLKEECYKDRFIAHVESIGAFMENMLLMATDMGIDSLWCGDILFTPDSAKDYLGTEKPPVAAAVFGYESEPTPRKEHLLPEDVIIRGYDEWKYR